MAEDIQQTHPLYASDRDILDSLLGYEGAPGPDQLTSAARLATRYREFPGADDIKTDLGKVVSQSLDVLSRIVHVGSIRIR